jgi:glutathione S-transferase
MAEYELYCFGESGNAFKVAMMLQAAELSWKPRFVDFFNGETRSEAYRSAVNEMGEAPVLVHGAKKLSQSGVILDYLTEQSRKFGAKSDDERREIMRWMLFDNHKFTSPIATLRFMVTIAKTGENAVTEWMRNRAIGALKIVNAHLGQNSFIIGKRPTIADFSLSAYLYYGDEVPIDMTPFSNVQNWLDSIRTVKGWKHPYELMPRHA